MRTDPRPLSGIRSTCSDEILHRAGLSPLALADRALSRLLGGDWPRTLEEMEL